MKKPETTAQRKPARNSPCPCGSGYKYKKCCGKTALTPASAATATAATPPPVRPPFTQETLAELQGLENGGQVREAGLRYQQLLEFYPEHPALLWGHGRCLMHFAYREPAAQALEQAITVFPQHEGMMQDILGRLIILGKPHVAERFSAVAIQNFPANDSILLHRADALRLLRCEKEAVALIRKIIQRNPGLPGAYQSLIHCLRYAGQQQEAEHTARLAMQLKNRDALERAGIENELAQILDARDATADAFMHFTHSGNVLATSPQAAAIDSDTYSQRLDAYCEALTHNGFPPTLPAADPREQKLIFLLGFPRSGTTLLESILGVLDGVQSSGESILLDTALSTFVSPNRGVDDLLDTIMQDDGTLRARARNAFWDKVTRCYGDSFSYFIDKQPMNLMYLPHLRLLFPDAKIIFCVRDPRDVCLSCFFQWFSLNGTNKLFLNWHSTANFYARLMAYWMQFEQLRDDNNIYQVRYEALVSDFETQLRQLTTAVDLPWNADLLRFHTIEPQRYFNTPSDRAVHQGITTARLQRWQHYLPQVQEVDHLLCSAIAHFGYDATPIA